MTVVTMIIIARIIGLVPAAIAVVTVGRVVTVVTPVPEGIVEEGIIITQVDRVVIMTVRRIPIGSVAAVEVTVRIVSVP